jgi:uncharacterized protein
MDLMLLLPLCLFIVGFLYASVGHGGASGYIAVFSLFGIAMLTYKPLVLYMNILVAGFSFFHFYRGGHFKWKLTWPFLISSIPAAFIGSRLAVHNHTYNLLLGIALLLPVLRFSGILKLEEKSVRPLYLPVAICAGAVIGLLSGMLNIGGGIFLSPFLIFMCWSTMKEAAASSALFIVCNSVAGLIAAHQIASNFTPATLLWMGSALAGGITGAYLGSWKFRPATIRTTLAIVLAIASVKLMFS